MRCIESNILSRNGGAKEALSNARGEGYVNPFDPGIALIGLLCEGREMSDEDRSEDLKYEVWGWVLFFVCAVLFTISGIINGDIIVFAGSVTFLVACVVFMIPLYRRVKQERADRERE